MDIREFSDQLRKRMEEGISRIRQEEPDELTATAKTKKALLDILSELERFILQYEFKDQREEMLFFKEIKPGFLSVYFYYNRLFPVKLQASFMDAENRKNYYISVLDQLKTYHARHIDFYFYYVSGIAQLDEHYFTRKRSPGGDQADQFSTRYDILISSLLADDKLRDYLQNALRNLDQNPVRKSSLKWTGSKTALVELIYALQAVGVFNNGAADVKQVATAFEELFDLRLGNYYDVFQQIRMRKINQTIFLDTIKEKLLFRIETINDISK